MVDKKACVTDLELQQKIQFLQESSLEMELRGLHTLRGIWFAFL